MHRRLLLPLLALAALAVPSLLAVPEPTADELKANRAQLEEWRKHPEQLAQLRRDLKRFLALSPERREQVLQLDADLQESALSGRLWNVLERYTEWLNRQPEADRDAIRNAGSKTERLKLIQELRDKEWMQRQPDALRKKWDGLDSKQRADMIGKLRQEERKRQEAWQLAGRFWKQLQEGKALPSRLNELDPRDREGVGEYLMPRLSLEEMQRLAQAAKDPWPAYLTTLVEIADRHPLALPGPFGPRSVRELPKALQDRFDKQIDSPFSPPTAKIVDQLRPAEKENNWPKFAIAVVNVNRMYVRKPLPRELWACNYDSLLEPMQDYVKKVLRPALTDIEWGSIENAENKWPDYPQAIQKAAEAHLLPTPPWETALHGPRERWDDYRVVADAELPDVPRFVLHDFAMKLDAQQKEKLKFSWNDPRSWERLKAELVRHQEREREERKLNADAKKGPGPAIRFPFPLPVLLMAKRWATPRATKTMASRERERPGTPVAHAPGSPLFLAGRMIYPHRIRLLGPWDCEPLVPALPLRRFTPPARLRDAGLADFSGRVRLVRRFGYPGRIDTYEHVWRTFAAVAGHATVTLNGQAVAGHLHRRAGEFEVTPLLAARNRLDVLLVADAGDAGLPGEIALEIRRDAFLRTPAAHRTADGVIHVTGLVVGQCSRPLELYALGNGRHLGYSLTEADPAGQPFDLACAADDGLQRIRIELVCVARCWYAAEVPLT